MERKEIIIQAAIQLMAKKGFYGVSVREISQAGGIRNATFYDHFESKELLLKSLLQYIIQQWQLKIFLPFLQEKNKAGFNFYVMELEKFVYDGVVFNTFFLLAKETVEIIPAVRDIVESFLNQWLNGLLHFPEIPNRKKAYQHLAQWVGVGFITSLFGDINDVQDQKKIYIVEEAI